MKKETVDVAIRGKKPGDRRWANRSINRKVDHLKGFANWIRAQVHSPCPTHPMEQIGRLDVPVLEAKRFSDKEMEALTTAAIQLVGTERRIDSKRFNMAENAPLKMTARPIRDYAIFALLKGSGLRISEVCNLNVEQVKRQRLEKVITKGSQERTVVISREAHIAIKQYLKIERAQDAKGWQVSKALFLPISQTKKAHPNSTGRMTPASVWNVIRKIAKRAFGEQGAKKIHPHLFRHHVGYVMNEKGGITAVQKQLGHRNIVYSAVYSQRTDEELEKILDEERL